MVKRGKFLIFLTSFLLFIVLFSYIVNDSEVQYTENNNINDNIEVSASLEGIENIIITKTVREVNISGYGLVSMEDTLTIKNLNNNPISSIFFGIPTDISEDLVFLEATGKDQNTLLTERSSMVMNGNEMVVAYFDSPLLPHQTRDVKFKHIYKNLLSYRIIEDQLVVFVTTIYPLVPYKMEDDLIATFNYPETASAVEGSWGFVNPMLFHIMFNFDLIKDKLEIDIITPFLENLGEQKGAIIFFTDSDHTQLEMKEINREIFISPWGIIKIKEQFSLMNLGLIDIVQFSLKVPQFAKDLYIYDDLGAIQGTLIKNLGTSKYKSVTFSLLQNRARITPNSTFKFNVEYFLPFEKYASLNWFQESIQIDLFTTIYEYLGRKQTINIIIDGCYNIDSITVSPEAIKTSKGSTTFIYKSDHVTPGETKIIQFTFTIDLFDILLRPFIFILIISLIASVYVLIVKTRKREEDITALIRKFMPVNEIREFCSLYEEKNALTLEIRQSEEDAKRKKMAKKKYKSILTKNSSKIDEIQREIIPFKKILMETSETFDNIVKRLDVLEAERISIKDSLTLLESRYKRGRLPSRAAYLKLSDDFKKRTKKIDRTIDKLIQQLRSYLL